MMGSGGVAAAGAASAAAAAAAVFVKATEWGAGGGASGDNACASAVLGRFECCSETVCRRFPLRLLPRPRSLLANLLLSEQAPSPVSTLCLTALDVLFSL
mmetsp:Transcript_33077/g.69171  ORF Transcript_33077/g.69171 Transcript_33077/m.69171 type:complete len:100 (-) Transcript_33077:423-722(-)